MKTKGFVIGFIVLCFMLFFNSQAVYNHFFNKNIITNKFPIPKIVMFKVYNDTKADGGDLICLGSLTDLEGAYHIWGVKDNTTIIDSLCPIGVDGCLNRKFFSCMDINNHFEIVYKKYNKNSYKFWEKQKNNIYKEITETIQQFYLKNVN
jgi:hypothetical protein